MSGPEIPDQESFMVERFSMVEQLDAEGNVLPPKSLGLAEVTVRSVPEVPSPADEAERLGVDIEDYHQG